MKQKTAANPGRPRQFDREAALQIAVDLFCRHGYEGVSIAELTQAMEISPPSLYAAFGGKEMLFREALQSYLRRPDLPRIECAGPIGQQVRELLRETVRSATSPGYTGCMVAAGMVTCGPEYETLAEVLAAIRNGRCAEFEAQLRAAAARGELARDEDFAAIGRYIAALIQGIVIQARDGAGSAELYAMVDMALRSWPGSLSPAKPGS